MPFKKKAPAAATTAAAAPKAPAPAPAPAPSPSKPAAAPKPVATASATTSASAATNGHATTTTSNNAGGRGCEGKVLPGLGDQLNIHVCGETLFETLADMFIIKANESIWWGGMELDMKVGGVNHAG